MDANGSEPLRLTQIKYDAAESPHFAADGEGPTYWAGFVLVGAPD